MKETIHLSKEQIAQWRALLGPAPVLSSEVPQLFEAFVDQLVICLRPKDFVEFMLILRYAVEAWLGNRAIRHGAIAIERRHEEGVRERMQRARLQHLQKQSALKTELRNQTPADIAALAELEEKVLSTADDVDQILKRKATEQDHNKAFERSMMFQEQLDKLIASASRRRDDALFQLEAYRVGLGAQAREAAQELLEVESPPKVPADEPYIED